uniref:U14-hexatoxin-Mg1a n=1 Tax=Macrothele gigas TaxID=223896 RepID=TXM13_MACGS|nr:RecName: Full=U14-hexatoxin-Mg1a; Short=U14-HXTX-Mg1a; AltName: Full=Neurotoxin magi-13; Flags: Precursor [Macrothele gigas]BAD13412.1 peptide toxin 8 precursor [Macrothele gigas]
MKLTLFILIVFVVLANVYAAGISERNIIGGRVIKLCGGGAQKCCDREPRCDPCRKCVQSFHSGVYMCSDKKSNCS